MAEAPKCFECNGQGITSFHPWVESLVHYLALVGRAPEGGSTTNPLASPLDFFSHCPYCTPHERDTNTALIILG